ncbi:MAG: TlpA family protein disulfide reductase [bacterium JZ-2024 1]
MKHLLKFLPFPAFFLFLLVLIIYGVRNSSSLTRAIPPNWPKLVMLDPQLPVPDLPVYSLQGEKISLKGLVKNWTLLNIWRVDCPPCQQEFPVLDQLNKLYQDKGFRVIGVNKGESAETVKNFLMKKPVSFSIYLDLEENLSSALDIYLVPTSFLIRPDGTIFAEIFGVQEWLSSDFRAYLNHLLRSP